MRQALSISVWFRILAGVVLLTAAQPVYAQTKPDSTAFYKDLQKKSKRSKFTRWLFETLVVIRKPKIRIPLKPAHFGKAFNPPNPFEANKGKIIRNILVKVLDPFGLSVNDTARRPGNRLERYANNIHVTSKRFLIRNQLLFSKGQPLNPLKMSESERILRQAPYITDARIYVAGVENTEDSVDVWVWAQDQWSIIPESGFDPTKPNLLITEKNFLGLGNSIRQEESYRFSDKTWSHYGTYGLFNIRRSFLSANFNYEITPDVTTYGINIDRPFFSPLTRWAGGFLANRRITNFYILADSTKEVKPYPISFDVYDGWLAKSWQLQKGQSINSQSTALVVGGRVISTYYHIRPSRQVDVYNQNIDQTLYLATVGISRREFYKEKYLYRFGANEDVPLGYAFQLIGGYLQRESLATQFYSGVSASMGGLTKRVGYFALQLAYGNFYNKTDLNRGVIRGTLNHFTDLQQFGRWGIRQFSSISTVFGLNRAPFEYIDLNGSQLYGFSSPTLKGQSKAILNLETVFYMPYNLLGFRLAPVLFIGLGKIGGNINQLLNSRVYQAYSIGLLVRNENLVFNTFELSIGIYPYLPGNPESIRFNPVGSYRLKVRDFALPKPDVVGYN